MKMNNSVFQENNSDSCVDNGLDSEMQPDYRRSLKPEWESWI